MIGQNGGTQTAFSTMKPTPCPCASGKPFSRCCAPAIDRSCVPESAEALMRSRYTAYTQLNEAYLLDTWHGSTRPAAPLFDTGSTPKWIGLQVRAHRQPDATHAEVEFIARYRVGGRAHRLHETSRFVLEDGRWLYVDGDMHEGHNAP